MKAKNPINKDNFGPDKPLQSKTHKRLMMRSLQEDGSNSNLTLDVNEDLFDNIWININVDGNVHEITNLKQIMDAINELTV